MKPKLKACLLGLLFPALLHGQEIGLLRMNLDTLGFQGKAALWGGAEEGGFRSTSAPSFQWTAGADAKVVSHGKFSSWTGSLSFEQMMGKYKNRNLYSSMLLEPDYFPLDILEPAGGTKSRQTVRLEAGFLTDFGYELAAGIKASVQAANTSKRADVPHSDFALKMRLEPTLTYVMDDDMGLVSTYVVQLRTESLQLKQAGADNVVFLDKGLRYGTYLSDSEFSVQEFSHGISELLYCSDFSVGAEALWKRGKAGKDRFQYPGSTISVFYEQTVQGDLADNIYRISYKRERDQLKEQTPEEVGSRAVSDRFGRNLGLKYESRFREGVFRGVAVSLDGNRWSERSTVVPSFSDKIVRYDGTATLAASLCFGIMDLDLDVLAGRGWWKDRGRAGKEDVSDANISPAVRLTDDWLRKMDYLMASRIGAGGTLTCRIPSVQGLYVQLYGSWLHGLHVTSLPGTNREIGKLTVGYHF